MAKLVRDEIPHIIVCSGKRPITHRGACTNTGLRVLLLDKLEEETKEVQNK